MSLAFIRQCQDYGGVSCIWTVLLIRLSMKWIEWGWLDQFSYLFSSTLLCYALDYSLFLSTQLFLEVWHCTLFHICLHPSNFKLWKKRIKEYIYPPTTAFLSSFFFITSLITCSLSPPNPISFFSHHGNNKEQTKLTTDVTKRQRNQLCFCKCIHTTNPKSKILYSADF